MKTIVTIIVALLTVSGCASLGIPSTPKTVRQGALALEKGYTFGATFSAASFCAVTPPTKTCTQTRDVDNRYGWPGITASYTAAVLTVVQASDPTDEELAAAHTLSARAHATLQGVVTP